MTDLARPFAGFWRCLRRCGTQAPPGLFAAAAAVLAYLGLGLAMANGLTEALDRRLLLGLRTPGAADDPIGSRAIEATVRGVTALGGTTLVSVVTMVAVLAFALRRAQRHALVMGGAVLAAWASSNISKALYGRPRPDLVPHEVYVQSASFPSGHATLATATYLTLALLVVSLDVGRRTKALVCGLAGLLVITVGFSRVYLGVHWPSDVLAGWCLGTAWATIGSVVLRARKAPT